MLRRSLMLTSLVVCLSGWGCDSSPKVVREDAFGPSKVRIHPTFTQVKDWTNDGKMDGVEVVVEILDSFDEPTRGSGTLIFELSDFRPNQPDFATRQLTDPWVKPLLTREQQAEHWSAALRAYTFQLPSAKISDSRRYVLDVSFETAGGAAKPGGARLFDRIVLEPSADKLKQEKGVKRAIGAKVHR